MTPEATDYLAKARDYIDKAVSWLDAVHRGDEAARTAYLAGFHAAQALIFERARKVAKTHRVCERRSRNLCEMIDEWIKR